MSEPAYKFPPGSRVRLPRKPADAELSSNPVGWDGLMDGLVGRAGEVQRVEVHLNKTCYVVKFGDEFESWYFLEEWLEPEVPELDVGDWVSWRAGDTMVRQGRVISVGREKLAVRYEPDWVSEHAESILFVKKEWLVNEAQPSC